MGSELGNASETLRNTGSLNPKQGEFNPKTPRYIPTGQWVSIYDGTNESPLLLTSLQQHKPGTKVNEDDNKPEFHLETHPPGSAPPQNTFEPQPNDVGSQALNPNVERGHGKESTKTTASQTMMGSTSQDVNTGFGVPMQGQTSTEVRHDGQHGRKNPGGGMEGVGATIGNKMERDIPSQRGLEKDAAAPDQRGDKGALAAEERLPDTA